ncbi:MAG: aconitase X swivel domain-containing protein [Tissierella sp.]|uniref:aconitase X swivel domain-containing protein n=1 Tax=Tissierella sp. TaxID=41274 RepID=UPI003F992053
MSKTYKCRKISKGRAEAEVVVSKDALCFYLVEPETGVVVEDNHDAKGKDISGKILMMPSGKGSSVVQADGIYKLEMYDKAPAGLIIEHADPVLVSSVIIMEVPMVHKVDKEFYEDIKEGDRIIMDADEGLITIL